VAPSIKVVGNKGLEPSHVAALQTVIDEAVGDHTYQQIIYVDTMIWLLCAICRRILFCTTCLSVDQRSNPRHAQPNAVPVFYLILQVTANIGMVLVYTVAEAVREWLLARNVAEKTMHEAMMERAASDTAAQAAVCSVIIPIPPLITQSPG